VEGALRRDATALIRAVRRQHAAGRALPKRYVQIHHVVEALRQMRVAQYECRRTKY
jgi:hypothetical protein